MHESLLQIESSRIWENMINEVQEVQVWLKGLEYESDIHNQIEGVEKYNKPGDEKKDFINAFVIRRKVIAMMTEKTRGTPASAVTELRKDGVVDKVGEVMQLDPVRKWGNQEYQFLTQYKSVYISWMEQSFGPNPREKHFRHGWIGHSLDALAQQTLESRALLKKMRQLVRPLMEETSDQYRLECILQLSAGTNQVPHWKSEESILVHVKLSTNGKTDRMWKLHCKRHRRRHLWRKWRSRLMSPPGGSE